eukprot:7997343-Alexandrium_andersonii.AAC.1
MAGSHPLEFGGGGMAASSGWTARGPRRLWNPGGCCQGRVAEVCSSGANSDRPPCTGIFG